MSAATVAAVAWAIRRGASVMRTGTSSATANRIPPLGTARAPASPTVAFRPYSPRMNPGVAAAWTMRSPAMARKPTPTRPPRMSFSRIAARTISIAASRAASAAPPTASTWVGGETKAPVTGTAVERTSVYPAAGRKAGRKSPARRSWWPFTPRLSGARGPGGGHGAALEGGRAGVARAARTRVLGAALGAQLAGAGPERAVGGAREQRSGRAAAHAELAELCHRRRVRQREHVHGHSDRGHHGADVGGIGG